MFPQMSPCFFLIKIGIMLAGAIIGKHHGVARKSSVVDVRAIDAVGVGTTVSILSALDFIAGRFIAEIIDKM